MPGPALPPSLNGLRRRRLRLALALALLLLWAALAPTISRAQAPAGPAQDPWAQTCGGHGHPARPGPGEPLHLDACGYCQLAQRCPGLGLAGTTLPPRLAATPPAGPAQAPRQAPRLPAALTPPSRAPPPAAG